MSKYCAILYAPLCECTVDDDTGVAVSVLKLAYCCQTVVPDCYTLFVTLKEVAGQAWAGVTHVGVMYVHLAISACSTDWTEVKRHISEKMQLLQQLCTTGLVLSSVHEDAIGVQDSML